MDTLQKIQLKERISGTILRLGWLMCIAAFVPMLLYVMGFVYIIARIFFLAVLMLLAMATLFLLLLSDGFQSALKSDEIDFTPIAQSVYQGYSAIIYVFLVLGIALGVLTILLAVKEGNGKSSRNKIISSGCMMAFLIIAVIFYMATKSKVMGA